MYVVFLISRVIDQRLDLTDIRHIDLLKKL
jgi:hypothetical protein